MIELNKIQADKICEIVDVRFDHFNAAQYAESPYNDKDPQYYFWPVPMGRSAFKINRVTGEYMEDELIEKMVFLFPMEKLVELRDMKDANGEQIEIMERSIEAQQKLLDKKKAVLDYLKSEKLL